MRASLIEGVLLKGDVEGGAYFASLFRRFPERWNRTEGGVLLVTDDPELVAEGKQKGWIVLAVDDKADMVTLSDKGADILLSTLEIIRPFRDWEGFTSQIASLGEEMESDTRIKYGRTWVRPVDSPLYSRKNALDLAVKEAAGARLNAYAPYSKFKVGAAVVSARTGRVYAGCNVENGSYGATICAERNAILHAISEEGPLGVEILVVVSDADPPAPPCAQCLQVLSEFSRPETEVHLVSVDGTCHEVYQFAQLLPHPFVLES